MLVDADLHGPFTVKETHGLISAGTLISEGETKESAVTTATGIGAPSRREDGAPFGRTTFDPDLYLLLLFIGGVFQAVYYGLFFDTTRDELHNVGLLNDRLCGVIGGSALEVMMLLIKILRKLPAKRSAR